jgi:hypothetical protein
MCIFSGIGAGDRKILQQENGSANGILDSVFSRRQSTRSRAGSGKEHNKTPLIEVKIFSSCISSFKYYFNDLFFAIQISFHCYHPHPQNYVPQT